MLNTLFGILGMRRARRHHLPHVPSGYGRYGLSAGTLAPLLYLGWKNRHQIQAFFQRQFGHARQAPAV